MASNVVTSPTPGVLPAQEVSPTQGSNPPTTTISTPHDFAVALLQSLGIQPNTGNVLAIEAWALAEGGHWRNTAHYNPLNTTQPEPGSSPMNSVGVQAYTSWQQGLNATVQTLRNGHYPGILQALQGSDPYAVATAVGASPWGTGNFSADIASAGGYAPTSVGGGTIDLNAGQTSTNGSAPNVVLTSSGGSSLNPASVLKAGLVDLAKLATGAAMVWAGFKMLTTGQALGDVAGGANQRRRGALRADEDRFYDNARQESAETKATPAGRAAQRRAAAARRRT